MGRVLRARGVGGPRAAFADRGRLDVRDGSALMAAARHASRLVNLASVLRLAQVDPAVEDAESARWREFHVGMAQGVIHAAEASGVGQLVLVSSVYAADAPRELRPAAAGGGLSHAAMNLELEAAGRNAAARGLDVVCVRLGALSWPDLPARGHQACAWWISHEDCAGAFAAILAAPVVPGRFVAFAAVSRLAGDRDDTENPFGWRPRTRRVGWRRRFQARVVDLKCRVDASPAGPLLRALVGRSRFFYARAAPVDRPGMEG